MPKEYVNCQDYGREVVLASDYPGGDVRAEVGKMPTTAGCVVWLKDGAHVALRVLDRMKDPDGFEVLDLNLDRDGINRLIRLLRRARDQAFGSDA